MKYGLIGGKIGYSYSKDIHDLSFNGDYQILSLNLEEMHKFMEEKKFVGINVTIPYKKEVLKYVYSKDRIVKKIGVCNTIYNDNGRLKAYNTDYYGFKNLLKHFKINVKDKNVLILGSGATSSTISLLLNDLKAKAVRIVSRNNYPTYKDIPSFSKQIDIIINATPYGTNPKTRIQPLVKKSLFKKDVIAIDIIFNPYRTSLLINFNSHYNGLYMLVAQAIKAETHFANEKYKVSKVDEIYHEVLLRKTNLVLVGMPSCGKTSIGQELAKKMNKEVIDIDELIEKNEHLSCKDIIEQKGINYFRKAETKAIKSLANKRGIIITTGGGAILKKCNIFSLKENGILIYIDRKLSQLESTSSRPLSNDKDKLIKLYKERKPLYEKCKDIKVYNNSSIENTCNTIISKLKKYK